MVIAPTAKSPPYLKSEELKQRTRTLSVACIKKGATPNAIHGSMMDALKRRFFFCRRKTLLEEDVELFISEWFRLRCNIDSTNALSSGVLEDLNNAKSIVETHSNGGAACQMPKAIEHLANAIKKIDDEILSLKCVLKIDDLVIVGSCEQTDKYVLLDKLLINNEV